MLNAKPARAMKISAVKKTYFWWQRSVLDRDLRGLTWLENDFQQRGWILNSKYDLWSEKSPRHYHLKQTSSTISYKHKLINRPQPRNAINWKSYQVKKCHQPKKLLSADQAKDPWVCCSIGNVFSSRWMVYTFFVSSSQLTGGIVWAWAEYSL